jgi:hypothetical protein
VGAKGTMGSPTIWKDLPKRNVVEEVESICLRFVTRTSDLLCWLPVDCE